MASLQAKHKAEFNSRVESSEDSIDSNNGGISTRQALIYVAIVLSCFAVLYPKMIHPMVKAGLGLNEKKPQLKEEIPPQMQVPRPSPHPHPGARPPPGARDHSSGNPSETSKGGSGGIMMSIVLPVYAFGIIGYLLYTASKVGNRAKFKENLSPDGPTRSIEVYGGGNEKAKKKGRNNTNDIYELITAKLATIDLNAVLTGGDAKGAEEINELAEYLRKKSDGESPVLITGSPDTEHHEKSPPEKTKDKSKRNSKKKKSRSSKKEEEAEAHTTEELLEKVSKPEQMSAEEVMKLQQRLKEMENQMSMLSSALQSVQTEKVTETLRSNADDINQASDEEDSGEEHSEYDESEEDNSDDLREEVEQIFEELSTEPDDDSDELFEEEEEIIGGVDDIESNADLRRRVVRGQGEDDSS